MKRILKVTTVTALASTLGFGGTALAGGAGYKDKGEKAELKEKGGEKVQVGGEEFRMDLDLSTEEQVDVGAEARGEDPLQQEGMSPTGQKDQMKKEKSAEMKKQDRGQQMGMAGEQQSFKGEVIRTKQVDIKGTQDKSMAVMIRTDKGLHLVADLGPVKDLKKANIKKGDKITIEGEVAQIGDRNVILADKVDLKGKSHQIERTTEVGEQAGDSAKEQGKTKKKAKKQPKAMGEGKALEEEAPEIEGEFQGDTQMEGMEHMDHEGGQMK